MPATDPAQLTADLIRCPSVTPTEGGALVLLESVLSRAGFDCTRVDRGGVSNLFARWGTRAHPKSFGFNGHTDVVPVGDEAAWTVDPFGAEIRGGIMYGRGATDMKSGVAAFVAAAVDFLRETPPEGAIVLTITGDEEGDAYVTPQGTVVRDTTSSAGGIILPIIFLLLVAAATLESRVDGVSSCPRGGDPNMRTNRRNAWSLALCAVGARELSFDPRYGTFFADDDPQLEDFEHAVGLHLENVAPLACQEGSPAGLRAAGTDHAGRHDRPELRRAPALRGQRPPRRRRAPRPSGAPRRRSRSARRGAAPGTVGPSDWATRDRRADSFFFFVARRRQDGVYPV